jgi:cytochrome c553
MNLLRQRAETAPQNEGRVRKVFGPQLALQTAIVIIGLSAAGWADAREKPGGSKEGFEAKIAYCQDCHGPSGQGYRGFFPIPRLAGQQVQYIQNQLQAFVERRRKNAIMLNVAHVLSPAMIAALAAKFHDFNPQPVGGAPRDLIPAGREIFENGLPDANIAACAACHGPDATGNEQIPRWPASFIRIS